MAQVQVLQPLLLHSGSRSRARSTCHGIRPLLRSSWVSVRYLTQGPATSPSPSPSPQPEGKKQSIVVLGGGITGLTTALSLARKVPPTCKIHLIESRSALGGWVNSERVQMPFRADGTALLEAGPRSLRPKGVAGWRMLELAISLGLQDRMIIVPSSAPSAKNRFILFKGQLNKLPSSLSGFLQALIRLPILRSLLAPAVLGLSREPFRPTPFPPPNSKSLHAQRSSEDVHDESIDSFMNRRFGARFGSKLVNNIVSAVFHGIYAADTRNLSVRSTMPMLWKTEQTHGSLLRALLPPKYNSRYRAPTPHEEQIARAEKQELASAREYVEQTAGPELVKQLDNASVFSFKDGIGELITALVKELQTYSNVYIRVPEHAESLSIHPHTRNLIVQTKMTRGRSNHIAPNHIVSALPSSALASLLIANSSNLDTEQDSNFRNVSDILTHNPSATVTVVNFVIPASHAPTRPIQVDEGFGFLIPRAENDPDGVLGVVFDSDAIPGQDDDPHTKLTVMISGSPSPADEEPFSHEAKAALVAKRVLQDYLHLPPSLLNHPGRLVRVQKQVDCIPTYLPGHFSRMRTLHDTLRRNELLRGKLSVTGASYVGVSLNDIVRNSMKLGQALAAESNQQTTKTVTGLEHFAAAEDDAD